MTLLAVVNQSVAILDVSPGSAGHDGVNGSLGRGNIGVHRGASYGAETRLFAQRGSFFVHRIIPERLLE